MATTTHETGPHGAGQEPGHQAVGSSNPNDLPLRDQDDVADEILPGGRLAGRIHIWVKLDFPFNVRIPWKTILLMVGSVVGGAVGDRLWQLLL